MEAGVLRGVVFMPVVAPDGCEAVVGSKAGPAYCTTAAAAAAPAAMATPAPAAPRKSLRREITPARCCLLAGVAGGGISFSPGGNAGDAGTPFASLNPSIPQASVGWSCISMREPPLINHRPARSPRDDDHSHTIESGVCSCSHPLLSIDLIL